MTPYEEMKDEAARVCDRIKKMSEDTIAMNGEHVVREGGAQMHAEHASAYLDMAHAAMRRAKTCLELLNEEMEAQEASDR